MTIWAVAITAVAAVAAPVHNYFHTDTEAELAHIPMNAEHADIRGEFAQYQEQQLKAFTQDRIDRHQREIKRLEYKLLSENLTPEQREYIARQIRELEETIKCIREGTC